jgi:hypothetical protein
MSLFKTLQRLPGSRKDVDVSRLARVMNSFFWSLLGQEALVPKIKLNQSIDSATHLIYHALFAWRCCQERSTFQASQQSVDCGGDFFHMGLEREVAGVQ